ncbi:zincin-like metallopeptidase domain-containing protein [Cyanobium sp. FGCU-6]|jgi:antirestriction protein ArdC|nr:zincin-like metallopeptidase domain-containing protein [Cyanobium sp. FGCU6]
MAAVTSTPASPPRKTPRHKIDGSGAEEKLVASLIALMEAGTTPWRREWDAAGGGHHVNLISGRRYRGANPVLLTLGLHLRGSALPYWCGFAEARRLGIFPRKGSKAVHVLRPQVHQRGEASLVEAAAPSSPVDPVELQGEGRRWVSYRPMALFNAADLEGEALAGLLQARREKEGLCRRPEPERLAAAEAVLSAWPVPVRHGGDRACYLPLADRIQLPERCAFHSASGLYATWAHEAIHSTGHASRLARDLTGSLGSPAYAREELVAELGAVLLGDRLEIGSDVRHHAAYLSHWIELLRESPRLLVQVLAQARRAVDLIAPEGVEEPG